MHKSESVVVQQSFPCQQCGAMLGYAVGTHALRCDYCGSENTIEQSHEPIEELGFHQALSELARARPAHTQTTNRCEACAAEFTFDQDVHSGECPFCGTSVVTGTRHLKPIQPGSLLSFSVNESDAKKRFHAWLKGLWFAPGKVKRYAQDDAKLTGVYVPYWTYDSATRTAYHGERGTYYQVRQTYYTTEKGRRVRRVRTVTKVRWRPVSGSVARHFDDVLVGASRSLPRQITDRLAPWDLENLVPFKEDYLSGFRSEVYQVALDEGFEWARQVMTGVIRGDVARDIGGDLQRIHRLDTRHSHTTFKHVLLPIWSAAFRYRAKSYRFVVNGRTGQVQGERPYSVWKITLAVLTAVLVVAGIAAIAAYSGQLESLGGGY